MSATLDTRTRDLVAALVDTNDRVRQSVGELTKSTIATVATEGRRTIAEVGEVQRQLRETMEQVDRDHRRHRGARKRAGDRRPRRHAGAAPQRRPEAIQFTVDVISKGGEKAVGRSRGRARKSCGAPASRTANLATDVLRRESARAVEELGGAQRRLEEAEAALRKSASKTAELTIVSLNARAAVLSACSPTPRDGSGRASSNAPSRPSSRWSARAPARSIRCSECRTSCATASRIGRQHRRVTSPARRHGRRAGRSRSRASCATASAMPGGGTVGDVSRETARAMEQIARGAGQAARGAGSASPWQHGRSGSTARARGPSNRSSLCWTEPLRAAVSEAVGRRPSAGSRDRDRPRRRTDRRGAGQAPRLRGRPAAEFGGAGSSWRESGRTVAHVVEAQEKLRATVTERRRGDRQASSTAESGRAVARTTEAQRKRCGPCSPALPVTCAHLRERPCRRPDGRGARRSCGPWSPMPPRRRCSCWPPRAAVRPSDDRGARRGWDVVRRHGRVDRATAGHGKRPRRRRGGGGAGEAPGLGLRGRGGDGRFSRSSASGPLADVAAAQDRLRESLLADRPRRPPCAA